MQKNSKTESIFQWTDKVTSHFIFNKHFCYFRFIILLAEIICIKIDKGKTKTNKGKSKLIKKPKKRKVTKI